MRAVVLDTGAIVGLLHQGDDHHETTIKGLKESAEQGRALVTVWEVVGEAFTLIRTRISAGRKPAQAMTVLSWAEDGGVLMEQSLAVDQHRAIALLRTHPDLRLSYVDGLLLAIAERLGAEEVLTVDAHLAAVTVARSMVVTRV